jgi:hypothetical protein
MLAEERLRDNSSDCNQLYVYLADLINQIGDPGYTPSIFVEFFQCIFPLSH